jgi:adenosylcobinamide kinase / adenosylcobinamide-phosphate guanylyltransferase
VSLTFLLGGARSGKSSLAVRLASATGMPVTVVATAEARDEEMTERIRAHREARPAGWSTIEEPLELGAAIDGVGPGRTVIVDCLSLWVSNALEAGLASDEILRSAGQTARSIAGRTDPSLAISNEVGLGIVPMHPLGRAYRDLLGRVNAEWAGAAERALFVVAGRVLPLREATEEAPTR